MKNRDGSEQYYTIVRNPEKSFSIISKDINVTTSASGSATTGSGASPQINAAISNAVQVTTVLLADKLDQYNSEINSQFKAALFGLNSNPTSQQNRDKFWEVIEKINSDALNYRLAEAEAARNAALQTVTTTTEAAISNAVAEVEANVATKAAKTKPTEATNTPVVVSPKTSTNIVTAMSDDDFTNPITVASISQETPTVSIATVNPIALTNTIKAELNKIYNAQERLVRLSTVSSTNTAVYLANLQQLQQAKQVLFANGVSTNTVDHYADKIGELLQNVNNLDFKISTLSKQNSTSP